jgi:hypothetical protein
MADWAHTAHRLESLQVSYFVWIGFIFTRMQDAMAEREGFEPPIALRLCLISSQVRSTGLRHLSALNEMCPRCFMSLPFA